MVNEIYNGSGSATAGTKMASDEYIEFVIVEKTTSAQLAAMTFGDTNSSTSQLKSVFQFDQATLDTALAGSGVDAFQAGTIIVVKGAGLGPQNLSYQPLSNNLNNSDAWSIQLVAGQGAKDSPDTQVNGSVSAGTSGDVVWIASGTPKSSTDTSGFISAIGYDNNPGTIAKSVASTFGSSSILPTTVSSGHAISNTGGATDALVVSTAGTMGTTNGGANDAWIVGGLRASAALSLAPEPDRASLLTLGGALVLLRRRRFKQGGAHV